MEDREILLRVINELSAIKEQMTEIKVHITEIKAKLTEIQDNGKVVDRKKRLDEITNQILYHMEHPTINNLEIRRLNDELESLLQDEDPYSPLGEEA